MKAKLKTHFKKHKQKYELALNTVLYIAYYLAAVFFADFIGLDKRYVVFWFMLMWTYPFEFLIDKCLKFRDKNEDVTSEKRS